MTDGPAAQAASGRRPVRSAGPAVLARRPASGGWLLEQAFPGTADQVRHVRSAVRTVLDGCGAEETAVHLFSELSANAVLHSRSGRKGGEFTVRLRHAPSDYVWGEVEDAGSEKWGGDLAASAREQSGLFLVTALAKACGAADQPGWRRAVWFCIPCHPVHAGDDGR
jgi:serine/threonine-protein kinase RsbW